MGHDTPGDDKRRFPRGRRILGLAALVLLGLAAGFILVELGARIYLLTTETDQGPGRPRIPGPAPGMESTITHSHPEYTITYNLEGGYRRPCPGNDDPAAPGYRLAILGDSFAFGSGVEECETFSALIAAARPRMLVSNFGRPGAGFAEALAVVEDRVCRGDYDGVLFLVFGNDFLVPPRPPDGVEEASAFIHLVNRTISPSDGPDRPPPPYIQGVDPVLLDLDEKYDEDPYYYSILADLLRDRDAFVHLSDPPADFRGRNLEVFDELMRRIQRCSDDVWVAVVPNGTSVDDQQRRYVEEHHGTVPAARAPGWVYKTIRARTRDAGGIFLETFDAFFASPDKNYYEADPHWTAAGHRLMARLLLDALPSRHLSEVTSR